MKLVIISSAPLINKNATWLAYSPYVKELEIWSKFADEVVFCCPIWKTEGNLLVNQIPFKISKIFSLLDFNIKTIKNSCISFFKIIINFFIIFRAMQKADHIHLRCPGNVGLLATIVQIAFPKKNKTAKYAGNWDPNAKSPISYRLQKWILSNTFLTKNMKVLVYGKWENQTKNIKPFFTATYTNNDKLPIAKKNLKQKIQFIFVGTLVSGKNPLYAIKIVEELFKNGFNIRLDLYGDGNQHKELQQYIKENNLQSIIKLNGNKDSETIKQVYKHSSFLILPSKSEGWPKAVAEAMFWGCVPVASSVSCVANMLDNGNRGIILSMNLQKDVYQIKNLINNEKEFQNKSIEAQTWSRKFTLDYFEQKIKLLLQP